MFFICDGNWASLLNDGVITYKNIIQSAIKMSIIEESNNPEKIGK